MMKHIHLWLRAHAQYPGYDPDPDHEQPFAQDDHHEQGSQAASYQVSI